MNNLGKIIRQIIEEEIKENSKEKERSEKPKIKTLKDLLSLMPNNEINEIIANYCFKEAIDYFYDDLYDDNDNYLFIDECNFNKHKCDKDNLIKGLSHILPDKRKNFIYEYCKSNEKKIISKYSKEI